MKFSYFLIKKILPTIPPKKELIEALNLHSFEAEDLGGDVFEVSLPANRYSDASSHIGIAREIASVFARKFKTPIKSIINPPSGYGFLRVTIKTPELCPRYAAYCFEIGKVGSSPAWLKKVLKSCGLKSINDIVDLMNYVMLETGQPLHAFDFDKLSPERSNPANILSLGEKERGRGGKDIIVRLAKTGEIIETLDGQRIVLDPQTLVIADKEKPLAIAGIKGGVNSGIDSGTRRIIVEAANFDAVRIYKSSHRLNLLTDAALRFSHNISPALVDWGISRATELLTQKGAKLIDSVDIYPRPVGNEIIEFDEERYERIIGEKADFQKIEKIFKSLGFEVKKTNILPQKSKKSVFAQSKSFLVEIPPWRSDIENFEDLVEEAARLFGYNKIQPRPPHFRIQPAEEEDKFTLKDRIRQFLVNLQFDEVYNYSFISENDFRKLLAGQLEKEKLVELENPISEDKKYLRPSLLPGLFKNIEVNSNLSLGSEKCFRIFELGKVFSRLKNTILEELGLGIVLLQKNNPQLILELKGIIDELLRSFGLTDISFVESSFLSKSSVRSLALLRIESDHAVLGSIKLFSLPNHFWAATAEINIEKLLHLAEEEVEFKPLPKYPSIIRDISLLVASSVRIGEVLSLIQKVDQKLIVDVDLIDDYVDEKFEGKHSLTFRIVFRAEDRTLTDEEVNKKVEEISKILRRNFGAEIR